MGYMGYTDFYDIAEYGSDNWRGAFSPREIAENAYIYKSDWDALGLKSPVIQALIDLLKTDGSDTATYWIERMAI